MAREHEVWVSHGFKYFVFVNPHSADVLHVYMMTEYQGIFEIWRIHIFKCEQVQAEYVVARCSNFILRSLFTYLFSLDNLSDAINNKYTLHCPYVVCILRTTIR